MTATQRFAPVARRRLADLARLRAEVEKLGRGDPPMSERYVVALVQQIDRLYDLASRSPDDPDVAHEIDRLVDEVLATYGGALLRRAGLDGGLCDLADRLVDEISPLTEVIPCISGADDEYGPLSASIRLRFPSNVWSLPFVAHELGHQVAFRHVRDEGVGLARRSSTPIADILEARRGQTAWSHLGELFSDVFATWTLGPSFAMALIALRFDDNRPDFPDAQHPSPGMRIEACCRVLNVIDELEDSYDTSLRHFVDAVDARRVAPAARTPGATPPPRRWARPIGGAHLSAAEAQGAVDSFLEVLRVDFRNVRYTYSQQALAAHRYLGGVESEPPTVPVRAAVDACWRVRGSRPGEPDAELSGRVTALFRTIVASVAAQ